MISTTSSTTASGVRADCAPMIRRPESGLPLASRDRGVVGIDPRSGIAVRSGIAFGNDSTTPGLLPRRRSPS